MSGPEHYRIAENLLANLRTEVRGDSGIPLFPPERQVRLIAEAQAHATLALAAATVADRGIGPEESSGWRALHADPTWQEAVA